MDSIQLRWPLPNISALHCLQSSSIFQQIVIEYSFATLFCFVFWKWCPIRDRKSGHTTSLNVNILSHLKIILDNEGNKILTKLARWLCSFKLHNSKNCLFGPPFTCGPIILFLSLLLQGGGKFACSLPFILCRIIIGDNMTIHRLCGEFKVLKVLAKTWVIDWQLLYPFFGRGKYHHFVARKQAYPLVVESVKIQLDSSHWDWHLSLTLLQMTQQGF